MIFHGYVRASTADQHLAHQEAALRAAGCRVVRAEKRSGAREDRDELRMLLDFLRADSVNLLRNLGVLVNRVPRACRRQPMTRCVDSG